MFGLERDALRTEQQVIRDAAERVCRNMALGLNALEAASDKMGRMQAVIDAARKMPRMTAAPGGAFTVHPFNIEASAVWALDKALTELDAG